jgi:hypothetical protein
VREHGQAIESRNLEVGNKDADTLLPQAKAHLAVRRDVDVVTLLVERSRLGEIETMGSGADS